MKKLLLILVFLLGQVASAQDSKRACNFIIAVDEDIALALANSTIILSQGNNNLRTIHFNYYPGNLSMNQTDYNEIMQFKGTILLKFDYYEYLKGQQKVMNYEIEMAKIWFEQPYLILNIYNTNKKKYRKLESLKGKEYTFQLKYSTGQMLRVRKK